MRHLNHCLRSLFVLALVIPGAACARVQTASAGGYTLQLEDEHGHALNTYRHGGATYVLGYYGSRYNVRITNHTNQRVEAVVSVDGRDVVSGATGDYATQRGYVVDPHDSVVIDGFRQSSSAVAAFRFTTPGDSYAGRMGSGRNIGVVGVAMFPERRRPHRRRIVRPAPIAQPRYGHGGGVRGGLDEMVAGAAEAAPMGTASRRAPRRKSAARVEAEATSNIGTQYGERRYSESVEVAFKRARATRPNQILSVYYDDANGLRAKGVLPAYTTPQPFPHQRDYAPPPPR